MIGSIRLIEADAGLDIGANLSDSMFDGIYHGKKSHQSIGPRKPALIV